MTSNATKKGGMNSHFAKEEIWMKNKNMKRFSTSQWSYKCKLRLRWVNILYSSDELKLSITAGCRGGCL